MRDIGNSRELAPKNDKTPSLSDETVLTRETSATREIPSDLLTRRTTPITQTRARLKSQASETDSSTTLPKGLIVSRDEIRRLEKEIQWKVLHHDRIPQIFDTYTILQKQQNKELVGRDDTESGPEKPFEHRTSKAMRSTKTEASVRTASVPLAPSFSNSKEFEMEIHAASSDA